MGRRAAFIASIAALLLAAPAADAATFTVTGTTDPGGDCAGTMCTTLRAAITAAGRTLEADTINVPAGVINVTSDYVIGTQIAIVGASARTTIIDGGGKSRGFHVTAAGSLGLANVTVRNGASGGGQILDGGAVYNAGTTQLADVRLTSSRAQGGGRGGGIANYRGYVVADNLLVDNNVADNGGGGIHNIGGPETPDRGWISLTDTTIFKNMSGLGGVGGLASSGTSALVAVSRSTIADNVAGARGVGGIVTSGTAQLVGSILARNLVAGETVNCGDIKPTDGNFNVEDDKDCGLAPGGMKPGLATALSNEGGQLDVLAISSSGDAFNRMPLGDTPCEGTDQRGMARPQSAACDAGAFELALPPFVTIATGPNGTVTGSQVEFTFQADRGGVTVQCDLTGPGQTAGFEPCYKENAQPYSGLADGPYTFSVRAVNAQYPNPPPSTRTFVVNTAPPNTTITGAPTSPTGDNTPTFTFSSSESGSTFRCRVGTSAFTTCTSPHTTAALGDGTHTFEVVAVDAAGVPDPSPATRTITVDTTAPSVTIAASPARTNDTTPSFTFTANEAATFECRTDATAFAACTSPYTTAALGEGSHTVHIRARDLAGNQGAAVSRTIVIDTTAPTVTITTGPTGATNDNTPTFGFTSEGGATFQCRVDGSTFAACSSPHTTATLSDGSHAFQVRATDAAGNIGSTSRTITVDTVSPNTTITSGPSGTIGDTTPTWTFSSSEPGSTFECSLEGADYSRCVTPFTPTLSPGPHTLSVRAVDPAQNRDGTPATRSVTVDTTAPTVTITAGPPARSNSTTARFTFSSTDPGATFECRLDTGAFAACASPHTQTVPAEGTHVFEVQATDAAGNVTTDAWTFTVDTTPPVGSVTGGPEGPTTDADPTFSFTASETQVECRLDGPGGAGTYEACVSPKVFSALPPGAYEFFVRVTDAAGNQTETRRAFQVTRPQPTPEPTAAPTQPPAPTPVPDRTVVVAPKAGTVLVKLKGEKAFAPLDVTKGIPNGSEVDVRKGRVTLTSIPRAGAPAETADFYGGVFVVTQKRGITDLKLSERLTGCSKARRASLAQKKKVRSRKLWGNGKGSFRTSGKYSAATVRGTIWLVQDGCTTTLTRVRQGTVQVNDFVKRKKVLVKQGKRYTARARKR